jgi:transposase
MSNKTQSIAGSGGSSRRSFSREWKRAIVEQTLAPGASLALIARQNDVNANQVFKWRRLYEQGRLEARRTRMLAVRIEDPPAERSESRAPVPEAAPRASGKLTIELRRGRVIVEGPVDLMALREVIERLRC